MASLCTAQNVIKASESRFSCMEHDIQALPNERVD